MAPLFLVSMATVGYEIALTRYFAVAKWSEYGYWVISIVLAGFALSGVVMALGRAWFARHGAALLAGLPAALILAAAVGYHFVTTNRSSCGTSPAIISACCRSSSCPGCSSASASC
jgi:hypothetical protein